MTIEETIKKATDGAWRPTFFSPPHLHNVHCNSEIFLDPFFWQALGKAIGRGEGSSVHDAKEDAGICVEWNFEDGKTVPTWQYQWHRFIATLAEGKSVESFFADLK